MGTSTNGQLCYGIPFGADYEFPWDIEGFEYGFEDWWFRKICGYKEPFELYAETKTGYIDDIIPSREKIDEYHKHRRDFEKDNPAPVKVVNYCSVECPMYIIAIPDTFKNNLRGYPEEIEMSDLYVSNHHHIIITAFCEKYLRSDNEWCEFPDMEPRWYLTSYWG